MTSDSAAYRDFVRRAARDLVAVPDSVMSLLCGRSFLALRPELYEKVREGQARFGLSTAQVYDDLAASCAIARRTLAYRLYFCFVRGVKYLFLLLRLAWLARVVFP